MNFAHLHSNHAIQVKTIGLNALVKQDIYLYPEEQEQYQVLKNDKRKKEFLGARELRNQLSIKSPIKYNDVGRPYLLEEVNTAISISHSNNLVTMCAASFEIGIDVEVAQDRIHKVIDKFATDHEKNLYQGAGFSLTEWYTFIWCMKEAVYKLVQEKGLSFKDGICIENIEPNEVECLQINASINSSKKSERKITVYCVKSEIYLFAIAKFKD